MKDIPGYDNYKLDLDLQQVYNIKKNRYLKNCLNKGSYYVKLCKNGKVKKYTIHNLGYMCNPIENKNLVNIPKYDNYRFDTELYKVYNIKTNMYLKNYLDKCGYYQIHLYKNGKSKTYGIHQLVYICNNPTDDISDYQIDHIDCDKTNNKIENLRKCSHSDNSSNSKTFITNKLGIKYIHKTKCNTYKFKLVKNGIRYEKTFKTLEQAIKHRDRVVREVCGEFANLG